MFLFEYSCVVGLLLLSVSQCNIILKKAKRKKFYHLATQTSPTLEKLLNSHILIIYFDQLFQRNSAHFFLKKPYICKVYIVPSLKTSR